VNRVVRLLRSAKFALAVWLLGGLALAWEVLAGAPDVLSGVRRLVVAAAVWFLVLALVLGVQRATRAAANAERTTRALATRHRDAALALKSLKLTVRQQRVVLLAVAKALGDQNRALESHRVLSIRHVNQTAALVDDRLSALVDAEAGRAASTEPAAAAEPDPQDEAATGAHA